MPVRSEEIAVVRPWDVLPGGAGTGGSTGGGRNWQMSSGAGGDGARYVLFVPADIEQVVLSETGEALPLLATYTDHRRLAWRKFELPAADETGRAPLTQTVALKLHRQVGHPGSMRINLEGALARPVEADEAQPSVEPVFGAFDPHASSAMWQQAAAAVDVLTHRHLELVDRLYDDSRAERGGMFWDNPGGGVGAWPLHRVIAAWYRSAEPGPAVQQRGDEAIVRLSRRLARLLNDVCHHPRYFLTRSRQILPADRVREVDAACVRWLARQPGPSGRRLVDRIGAKREAMAVVRYETADTVENRVVRDLIRRARGECRRVLERRQQQVEAGDPIIRELTAFTELLDRLERDSPLADVPPTGSVPRPNHVLARDPRYRALWRAYMDLVKRQQQRSRTWRWRRRIWAESCQVAVLAAMQHLAPAEPASRSPVLLRPQQTCGRFIDPRTALGKWELPAAGEAGCTVFWLDAHQLHQYQTPNPLPERLLQLCPDGALLLRDRRRPDQMPLRLLAIWATLAFDIEGDRLQKRTTELAMELRQVPGSIQVRGLLLQPSLGDTDEECAQQSADGDGNGNGRRTPNRPLADMQQSHVLVQSCLGLRLPLPVQRGQAVLENAIREMLIQ